MIHSGKTPPLLGGFCVLGSSSEIVAGTQGQGQEKLVLSLVSLFSSLENMIRSAFLRKVKYFLTFEYRNGAQWHCPQRLIKAHRVFRENDVQLPCTQRSNFL